NNKKRKNGTWTPEDFKTPIPKPFENWDINTTKPVPYRAFKHNYFVTMGIRSMDWENWIELDNEWLKFHNRKLERLEEKGTELYGTLPVAMEAGYEFLEELTVYLSHRYPSLFSYNSNTGILDNLVTKESFNILERPLKEDPMLIAAKLTQDDLAIMIEEEDGLYYLKGGAVLLPGFWRLKDKINLPLYAIHTTGDVPKYNEKLRPGMDKFFHRLTPEKPVVRNNYFIQLDDDLGWSFSIGDESGEAVGWYTAKEAKDVKDIYFRSERQSLRRLPKSGAIVFTVRTYFLPITQMGNEPYVPRRLLDGINSWTEDVQAYRGFEKFKDVLLPYLEKKAKEQEEMGYTPDKEPVTYPF
ncbi:heme-dependent oxidative N-demethylase family protein ASCRUDRAFT_18594, partial [Ascoidea rubescens DSM 1968]